MKKKSKEMKEMLIKFVNEIGDNVEFWNSSTHKKKKIKEKIGSGNIRKLALAASNADCYQELKLFIKYKTSRDGTGWDEIFHKEKKFGNVILEYLDKIYDKSENEKDALENISRFFGYLYWKKKEIGDE